MKRFVKIILLPIALMLGHVLVYNTEREYLWARSLDACDYYLAAISQSGHLADSPDLEFEDGYVFSSKTVSSSTTKAQESAGNITQLPGTKKIKTVVPTNSLGIIKYGKLLNSNKIYDYQNTLSYHTSGVRASVDRLFTLESVRC